MKFLKHVLLLMVLTVTIVLSSCSNDDDNTLVLSESETYDIYDVNGSEVMGTVSLFNNDSTAVVLTIQLAEATGAVHPAAIYFDTANENGGSAITLNAISEDGFSATGFSALDNGTDVTYLDMLDFNGNIKIDLSSSDNTTVAMGDIGQNALTGNTVSRALENANSSGVDGIVIFAERNNGGALIALEVEGTVTGNSHPVYLINGSIASPGTVAATLNPIIGEFGEARTSIFTLDDGTPVLYSDLINFDGHINVLLSNADATIVSQGNIGTN
jgi:hypothetical protein